MNSPITGLPMEIVTRSATIINYKDFDYFVELDAYYCEESDEYYTDNEMDQKALDHLEYLRSQLNELRMETGVSTEGIQPIYNMMRNFNLSKFKKYYKSHGPKF